MQTIVDRFPYFEVKFTKEGEVHDEAEVDRLLDSVGQGNVTDLFAISHGWNNDMSEARGLYKELFERVRDEIDADRPSGIGRRKFAVFGRSLLMKTRYRALRQVSLRPKPARQNSRLSSKSSKDSSIIPTPTRFWIRLKNCCRDSRMILPPPVNSPT